MDIATAVIALIGVILAVGALYLQYGQRRFEFSQQYINRYWTINDDQLRAVWRADLSEQNLHFDRYLRLCEDEFEVARLGWIDRKTWRVWHSAIRSSLGSVELDNDATQYVFVKLCIHSARPGHDHMDCEALSDCRGWRWRLFRIGL